MSTRIPFLVFALSFISPLGYNQSSSRIFNPSYSSKTIGQMAVENIYDPKSLTGTIPICISI
jgi:hypothetical protein